MCMGERPALGLKARGAGARGQSCLGAAPSPPPAAEGRLGPRPALSLNAEVARISARRGKMRRPNLRAAEAMVTRGVSRWGLRGAWVVMVIILKGRRSRARRAKRLPGGASACSGGRWRGRCAQEPGRPAAPPPAAPSGGSGRRASRPWAGTGRAGTAAPPSSAPGSPPLNPRAGAPGPLGSAEQASGQREAEPRVQPAGMAPAAASGGSSLPSGFSVFTTFPDLLFIFEFIFGGLVWILIASSLVPIPLVQGWVMFVSVFCFMATTALLVLYIIGAHGGETSWVTLDAAYHCIAALFYLSASVLEALATIGMQEGYTYKQYHENISAVVFSYVATLLYVVHAVFSLIRWKSS
uniref:Myelin and lymphocyte protein n=1 Tax=Canis lupus familiaris TaxID=9615 RepID=A0A8C0S140_CANLF